MRGSCDPTETFPHIVDDYLWAIRLGLLTHSANAWRSWVEGYEEGERLGLRLAAPREPHACTP
jgi:hypothetical protein